jgi:uncharacterized protein (DUF3084 family)
MVLPGMAGHDALMLDLRDLKAHDLQGLSPDAVAALARRMLQHIERQAGELQQKDREIERKDREIALREARLEKVQFELARLKRWKFGAKTEAMSADQRRLFEETLAEDEAGLQAQLDALRAQAAQAGHGAIPNRRPRHRYSSDRRTGSFRTGKRVALGITLCGGSC